MYVCICNNLRMLLNEQLTVLELEIIVFGITAFSAKSAFALLVEEHPACKKLSDEVLV